MAIIQYHCCWRSRLMRRDSLATLQRISSISGSSWRLGALLCVKLGACMKLQRLPKRQHPSCRKVPQPLVLYLLFCCWFFFSSCSPCANLQRLWYGQQPSSMNRLHSCDFSLFDAGQHRGDYSVERECEEVLGRRSAGVGEGAGQRGACMIPSQFYQQQMQQQHRIIEIAQEWLETDQMVSTFEQPPPLSSLRSIIFYVELALPLGEDHVLSSSRLQHPPGKV